MIQAVSEFVSWVLILAGSFFYLTGAIGLLRLPDVFARMHAASVSDTVGAGLLLVGMIVQAGLSLVTAKLLVLLALLLITGPVATHALARAARYAGVEPVLAGSATVADRTDSARKTGSAPRRASTSTKRSATRKAGAAKAKPARAGAKKPAAKSVKSAKRKRKS